MNLSVRCKKLTTRNPVDNTPIKDKKKEIIVEFSHFL